MYGIKINVIKREAVRSKRKITLFTLLISLLLTSPAHADDASKEWEALNQQATSLYQQGQYDQAIGVAENALQLAEQALGKEHPNTATSLNKLAFYYDKQRRYAESEPLYKRALAIREKNLGPQHLQLVNILNNLAWVYNKHARYAEVEPLYKRVLTIREKALGPGHPKVARALNNLASLYDSKGHYAEAEPLYKRALAIREKTLGPEHTLVANSLNNLAALYVIRGRYAVAEPLYERALAIREKALGSEHTDVANSLNNLAFLYDKQGRYTEAEPLFRKSLAIDEKALGPHHPRVARTLVNLAWVYDKLGSYAKAEPLLKEALAIQEKALGFEHPDVANSLNSLATLYMNQGRYAQVEPLYLRSLAIREKVLGPEHPDVGVNLNNLALFYIRQDRYAEAEPLMKRVLSIDEKAYGSNHPDIALDLNNLASIYQAQGRYAEAEPLYRRALTIRENTLGPEHTDVANSLNNLALFYRKQGNYAEAESLYIRSVAIDEKALGAGHPRVTDTLNNLAFLYQIQNAYDKELPLRRRALDILAKRHLKGSGGKTEDTGARSALYLPYLSLLAIQPEPGAKDMNDALTAVQLARQSETAAAFQFLAQRLATGDSSELAQRVRERQELAKQLEKTEKRLLGAYSLPTDKRPPQLTEELRAEVDRLQTDLGKLTQSLGKDFPAFSEFEGKRLADIESLQQALKPNEAVLAWILGMKESYLLILRKQPPPKLQTLSTGQDLLTGNIEALLQALALDGKDRVAPFPAAKAAELFRQLIGKNWKKELAGIEHLFLVPEGPLTRLPFSVLLTETPKQAVFPGVGPQYRQAPWLVRRFGMSVLPSLSALTALRNQPARSKAGQPFIGIGDPLLNDHPARHRGTKKKREKTEVALFRSFRGLGRKAPKAKTADELRQERVELIREQYSLPDTADELKQIANILGGKQNKALLLRDKATESQVKQTPLSDYNILSFATHGVLAGELGKGIEPGLILTPPKRATEADDGYLTVSEVARLKLNADWVVLSACNTGGGRGKEAEGLTGLAKAFAYAGAKALFVSHWAVNSASTVELMGRMFKALKVENLSRAEAHRQAMLQMIDSDEPMLSHPSLWAPFVVVGEGG